MGEGVVFPDDAVVLDAELNDLVLVELLDNALEVVEADNVVDDRLFDTPLLVVWVEIVWDVVVCPSLVFSRLI